MIDRYANLQIGCLETKWRTGLKRVAAFSIDFLKVARLLLFEWTWRERLLSLAARQIYRRNFPPVALSNQNQQYEITRQSSQIITRSRAKLFEHTTLSSIAIVISVYDQELLNSSH